ncbi:MAG: pyruvate, phosphate dikinase, partial [Propionibacteriaceae bacterium]|nr:pyruvate, phosphate dikinase [Propionibacteriaceae bacterium]
PAVYDQFQGIVNNLEDHYRDMQDMEFTIEDGKLFMLQTRNGKRTAAAAFKIACDLVDEGRIDEKAAIAMIDPKQIDALLHPQFDAAELAAAKVIGKGLPASPGAATGGVVFTAEKAAADGKAGKQVVLVRLETTPEDIEGMHYAQGILTARGGMTSHAAVVARGMGTCCVSGLGEIKFGTDGTSFTLGGQTYHEGDWISLDGSTGNVYGEQIKTVPAEISGYFGRIMEWADRYRTLNVRTNADTPADARQARAFGAEGIGLTRTEHMFFEADRIAAIREMIVSDTAEQRKAALAKILPMQRGDFEGIYEAMDGLPVTIRLLDPPLHEFLPHTNEEIKALAAEMGITFEQLRNKVDSLHEFNPMMGHRGCRLDVTFPEIGEMQTQAIIEAAINVQRRHPEWKVEPEIMVPLVGEKRELAFVKRIITDTADKLIAEAGIELHYKVGTMIEIPRAALTADEIAEEAEFFSFGTNDLTQMTFGFSRDDAAKFLDSYYETKIYESDPFARLDQIGVGKLVELSVKLGRQTRPDIKLGICGEHGGDPSSIEFCHRAGLNYVSCSPFRVPVARLAAAQAALR